MNLPPLTRAQSREVDRRAIGHYSMSGLVLMENAGRGTVDVLEQFAIDGPVLILCGKGNNAGDGFVIARHLAIRAHEARVLLLGRSSDLRGDGAANFAILEKSGVAIAEVATCGDTRDASSPATGLVESLERLGTGAAWIVDAMLGTGATGAPRPPFDDAIDWMNAQTCRKLAVDIPSGLDCDTGNASPHTVRADHTCTYGTMKVGLTRGEAASYTGMVHVCDIGVPPRWIYEIAQASQ